MVIIGMDAHAVEFVADLLGALAGSHIHDGRTGHSAKDMHQFSDFLLGGTHNIGQIAARKTHREHVWRLEAQATLDVLDHDRRGGGSECQHRGFREELAHLSDAQE